MLGAQGLAPLLLKLNKKIRLFVLLSVGIFISKFILALNFAFEKAQCLPFYNYDEDGTNRREDIADWALKEYRNHYQYTSITNDSNRL